MRIRSSREFERIYRLRQKASDGCLLVFAAANGLDHSRIGVSVSKKHGNAVCRNRLKRLLREAFRLLQHELPQGLDFILIPLQNCDASLPSFQRSLKRSARKLAQRLADANEGTR